MEARTRVADANLKESAENADLSGSNAKNEIYSSVFTFTFTIDSAGSDLSLPVALETQPDSKVL